MHTGRAQNGIPIGLAMDHLSFIDGKGDTLRLGAYKGQKLILLDFWASWCGPCRRLTPSIKKLQAKYDGDVAVISIALQDRYEDWKEAVAEDKLPWPQVLGIEKGGVRFKSNAIPLFDNIVSIPFLILIGKDGKIIRKFGYGDGTLPETSVAKEIGKILNAK